MQHRRPPSRSQNYAVSRAKREQAEASLAELELGEANGTLLSRESVERAVFESGRWLRDSMASSAGALGATVAPLTSAAACEFVIAQTHRQLLADFVSAVQRKLGLPAEPAPPA